MWRKSSSIAQHHCCVPKKNLALCMESGGKLTDDIECREPQHRQRTYASVLCARSVAQLTLQTPWIVAHQAPLSVGFSRQECWSRLSFPPTGDLPTQRSNHVSCVGRWILYHWGTWEAQASVLGICKLFLKWLSYACLSDHEAGHQFSVFRPHRARARV